MEKLKGELQKVIGNLPLVTIQEFQNWGKTVGPVKVFSIAPTTVDELKLVVKAAAKYGLKVRVHGGRHSWSNLFSDAGQICIDGKKLKLSGHDGYIVLSQDRKTITMSSGVGLKDLSQFFTENQVCFESNVILELVTSGGIFATGCHGVGWDQQSVSDLITCMKLVDSSGEIRTFTASMPDKETMKALQVNLGLFGIMTEITVNVKPMLKVDVNNLFPTVYETFFHPEKLRELVKANWSCEIFWFPFNSMKLIEGHGDLFWAIKNGKVSSFDWNPMVDQVWVRAINPLKPGQLHLPPVGRHYHEGHEGVDYVLGEAAQLLAKVEKDVKEIPIVGPLIVDSVQRHLDPASLCAAFKIIKDEFSMEIGQCQAITDAIHYRHSINLTPVYDMEFAFDCPDDDFHNICTAITYIVERVQHYAKEGKYPLTTAMEMRWIAYSDTLLCPAIVGNPKRGGSGHTFYLEVLSFEDNDKARAFFQDVASTWQNLPGVKPIPHWGKMWPDGMKAHVQEVYGKKTIDKFKKIRDKLHVDPDNMFTNETLRDIFDL